MTALPSPTCPRLRFDRLLWMMPAIYAVHICEEWFGGFPQYIADAMGSSVMPGPTFWINNSVFMAIPVTLAA